MTLAYTWTTTVGGTTYKALNSDISGGKTFIEIERGPYPGVAKLTFRAADATAIMADDGPLTISITPYTRAGNAPWVAGTPIDFEGWYPEISAVVNDDTEVVQVTLVDSRRFLSLNRINARYNVYTSDTTKDPATLNGGVDEWELGEVLADIFARAPSGPAVTLIDAEVLDNLVFRCSVSEAIEQILALRGKVYVWDPFTGTAAIEDLDGTGDGIGEITAALIAGKLMRDHEPEDNKFVRITLASWAPLVLGSSAAHIFPSETKSGPVAEEHRVILRHFQTDETGFLEEAGKWYNPLLRPMNQELFGIVKQPPTPRVALCRWEFKNNVTRSYFRNFLQRDVPWPEYPIIVEGGGSAIRKGVVKADLPHGSGVLADVILVADDTTEATIDVATFDFTQAHEVARYDWLTGEISLQQGDIVFVAKMGNGQWQIIGAQCKEPEPNPEPEPEPNPEDPEPEPEPDPEDPEPGPL